MDRREALRRLGAAGAIVVGGSAVLSTRDVAYAASGSCVAVIPPTATLRFRQTASQGRLIRVRFQPSSPAGAQSQTYSWRNAAIVPPTTGGVEILGANSRQARLRRITSAPRARDRVWVDGDVFRVQVLVTWTCAGLPPDEVTYEITQAAQLDTEWFADATLVS